MAHVLRNTDFLQQLRFLDTFPDKEIDWTDWYKGKWELQFKELRQRRQGSNTPGKVPGSSTDCVGFMFVYVEKVNLLYKLYIMLELSLLLLISIFLNWFSSLSFITLPSFLVCSVVFLQYYCYPGENYNLINIVHLHRFENCTL